MPFTPQLLGQTEKALNAILDRLLTGRGVTEPQWVTLSLAVAGGEADLTSRVDGALKKGEAHAQGLVATVEQAGLIDAAGAPTAAGRELFDHVRARTAEITARLWGDLPAEDLEATARVLSTALGRADEELSRL